jgi:hypothetical protein
VKGGSDNQVSDNLITANNRPNNARPGTDNAGIPPGLGIAINGADNTLVSHNTISDNDFAAVAISNLCIGGNVDCSQPLDVDPVPDGNRILQNRIFGNAANPSGPFGDLAADIVYLPDTATEKSHGNCFRDNGANLSVSPKGVVLPSCSSPPPVRLPILLDEP